MPQELIIHFNTPTEFFIRYDDDESDILEFVNPISNDDYQDMRLIFFTRKQHNIAFPD